MGRKIPGRKHRGIKNPLEQQAKRNESLKTKINAPPTSPEEQQIPKSLLRIMQLKQDVRDMKFRHKKKKKNKNKNKLIDTSCLAEKDIKLPGMTRPDKPVPQFKQRPGESDHHFLYRIQLSCEEIIKENEFEDKFGVEVKRDPNTGDVISVDKKAKDDSNEVERESSNKERKLKKHAVNKEKLSKSEKRRQKLLARKQSKVVEEDDFYQFRDEVKFGEVVHQPPMLKTPLKLKAKTKALDGRPGKRDLLLKHLLESKFKSEHGTKLVPGKIRTVDLSGKRKKIPAADRRQLELQRLEVVKAYRTLKTNRVQQLNAVSK